MKSGFAALAAAVVWSGAAQAHDIESAEAPNAPAAFDITRTGITGSGDRLEFSMVVRGEAGADMPAATGKLAGAGVAAYVWPTDIDPAKVGFGHGEGRLALVVAAHPDFDDTPRADENGDGNPKNDGALWHSHWAVLTPDQACGADGLKVKDVPAGAKVPLPDTWAELPILLDSPGYQPKLTNHEVRVSVPSAIIGDVTGGAFDGVTARLVVNAQGQAPLLCVAEVHDATTKDISLAGRID